MSTKKLVETKGKPAKSLGNGVFEVKIIESGWGSSGYYSPEMLKEFGPATFRAGRPSFANHPTDADYDNGRDITKIMGKLVTDAEFREDNALWATLKVRPEWVEFVEDYKDTIGLSIFASGHISEGEVEGRTGTIVESFDADDPYTSVDFVVAAGAGGKVERMLESFRAHEAMTSDRREALNDLIRDTYSVSSGYVWVRDFDEASNVVYFDVEGDSGSGTYQQSYSVANDNVTGLVGDKVEVRQVTTYVAVDSGQTTESASSNKENGMTPEEKAEFATLVAEATAKAIVEAQTPAPAESGETEAVKPADVAEALVAANLPESARKRVYAAIEAADGKVDLAAVIEAETKYIDELKESLKGSEDTEGAPGRFTESASGTTETTLKVRGW